MNIFTLLLISDRLIEPVPTYTAFIILGLSGLLLGLWRWWLGAIWLILLVGYAILRIDEVKFLYADIFELGFGDFWHLHLAILFGVSLNLAGIFIKRMKPKLP